MLQALVLLLGFCLVMAGIFYGIIDLFAYLAFKSIVIVVYLWSAKRRKKVKKLVSKLWLLAAENDLGLIAIVVLACGLMLLDLFRAIGH